MNVKHLNHKANLQNGFTLLEVIIVLALIGIILATVRYTVFTNTAEKEIEKEVQRLNIVFNMASDFAVINQLEMGLRIDEQKRTYEFVALNADLQWQAISDQKHFGEVTMSEGVSFELILDGLPWQEEDSLFGDGIFDERLSVSDESVNIGDEEEEEPPPPQIFILSSGEITPFELHIRYEGLELGEEPFEFSLQGQDSVPLIKVDPE